MGHKYGWKNLYRDASVHNCRVIELMMRKEVSNQGGMWMDHFNKNASPSPSGPLTLHTKPIHLHTRDQAIIIIIKE